MVAPLRRFAVDAGGGMLVSVGLALPVLLGGVAAAVEYGSLLNRRQELQLAADQAAMAGANQFLLANADNATVKNYTEANARTQARTPSDRETVATAVASKTDSEVKLTLAESVPTVMGKLLSLPTADLQVHSSARLVGSVRLCLLALSTSGPGALHLEKKSQLTAEDCSTYSNSSDARGLQADDSAAVTARSNCSAGGYQGARANFAPAPRTGCPQLRDPLASRAAPSVGDCISLSPNAGKAAKGPLGSLLSTVVDVLAGPRNVVSRSIVLDPGTYCGGLHITEDAVVTLNPGTYVMKDGPLIVDKKATMQGQNVGFYFTGDRGGLRFDKDTTISLTAPKDGVMAGLLMFEDRAVANPIAPPLLDILLPPPPPPPGGLLRPLREYRIMSDNARTMLGTIYLPVGRLIIDAKKPVADQSAYTVIVAYLVNLYEGPNLVLNARYSQTDIPVPKGVGPTSGSSILTR